MTVTDFFCDKSFTRPGPTVLVRFTRVDPGAVCDSVEPANIKPIPDVEEIGGRDY